MTDPTKPTEEYRIEQFTSRQVYLIKSALMKEITNLNSGQNMAVTNKERKELKTLKLETFEVYQKL